MIVKENFYLDLCVCKFSGAAFGKESIFKYRWMFECINNSIQINLWGQHKLSYLTTLYCIQIF